MSRRDADPDPWDDPLWYARYRSDPALQPVESDSPARPGEGLRVVYAVATVVGTFCLVATVISVGGWFAGVLGGAALSTMARRAGGVWLEQAVYAGVAIGFLLPLALFAYAAA